MSCNLTFHDVLGQCPDGFTVRLLSPLPPYSEVSWLITDKFGNEYSKTVDLDGNGYLHIPLEDLPDGFLTQFSGIFTLELLDGEQRIDFALAQYYDKIQFTVVGGTRVKDTIGVEI